MRHQQGAGSESDTATADVLVDESGVDRAQIREMLALAPEQRLRRMQQFVQSIIDIRALNEERPLR